MKIYRYTLIIDDEIQAETLEEAWAIVKARDEDNWYGPTIANLEFISETSEQAAAE